jgi:hypothetical protein
MVKSCSSYSHSVVFICGMTFWLLIWITILYKWHFSLGLIQIWSRGIWSSWNTVPPSNQGLTNIAWCFNFIYGFYFQFMKLSPFISQYDPISMTETLRKERTKWEESIWIGWFREEITLTRTSVEIYSVTLHRMCSEMYQPQGTMCAKNAILFLLKLQPWGKICAYNKFDNKYMSRNLYSSWQSLVKHISYRVCIWQCLLLTCMRAHMQAHTHIHANMCRYAFGNL